MMSVVWSRRRKGKRTKPYPIKVKRWRDRLRGGLADQKRPSDFDKKALAQGILVEMEHTRDRRLAMEIAMDHLTEDPKYYGKLRQMENPIDIEHLISTRQAVRMIANKEVPATGSSELQTEYDRVNREHFKGHLPDATVLMVNMPQVQHKAFTVPQAKVVIINSAKAPSLDEQKADLKHEMIHLSGIEGHGGYFDVVAKAIGAPVRAYEGRSISSEEFSDIQWERKRKREEAEQKRLEEKHGIKKGEGQLIQGGKPVARVIAYDTAHGFTTKTVRSMGDVPISAKNILITTFDQLGYPIGKSRVISREELNSFTLTR